MKDLPPVLESEEHETDFLSIGDLASYATVVLKPGDIRISTFGQAIDKEVRDLEDLKVFQRVIIPKDQRRGLNILRYRYVFAIKNIGTAEELNKARLVVQAVKKRR